MLSADKGDRRCVLRALVSGLFPHAAQRTLEGTSGGCLLCVGQGGCVCVIIRIQVGQRSGLFV